MTQKTPFVRQAMTQGILLFVLTLSALDIKSCVSIFL